MTSVYRTEGRDGLPRRPLTAAETGGRVLDQGGPVPCRGHAIRTKPVTTLHATLLGRGFNSRHLHQWDGPRSGAVLCVTNAKEVANDSLAADGTDFPHISKSLLAN